MEGCSKVKLFEGERGFNLIELVTVMAIVVCLSTLVLPSFDQVFKESRLSDAKSILLGLQLRLDKYIFEEKGYPDSIDDLVGINTKSEHFDFKIEDSASCEHKWCYVLVAQPKNKERAGEMLKIYSSGKKEGNW